MVDKEDSFIRKIPFIGRRLPLPSIPLLLHNPYSGDMYYPIASQAPNPAQVRRQRIDQDLETGKLPDEIMETYRFLPPDHPATVEFADRMQAITQTLLGDDYDATKHHFRFLISDKDSPNAMVISSAKPPIIALTTGLIRKTTSEDMLAAALAHELGHDALYNRVQATKDSTKLEEAGADAWGTNRMQKAGYAPDAMLEFLDSLEEEKDREARQALQNDPLSSIEIHIKDPHPPIPVRKRNVENTIAMIEQKGEVHTHKTPLTFSFLHDGTDFHHASYVENWLKEQNYHSFSIEQKLAFLKQHILEFACMDNVLDGARIEGFSSTILALKEEIPGHEVLTDHFIEYLLTYPCNHTEESAVRKFYYSACDARNADQYTPFTEKLSSLADATKAFVEAQDKDSACIAAEKIESIASQFTFPETSLIRGLQWGNFKAPGFGEIKNSVLYGIQLAMPWNQHVKWATEDQGAGLITKALHRLNITDSRLPECPWNYKGAFAKIYCFDYQIQDLTFDENGYVTACRGVEKPKPPEPKGRFSGRSDWDMQSSEKSRLQELDERAENVLLNIDWLELEKDFSGFINKYKEFLEPQFSVVDGGTKFQEAFVTKINELYELNPAKYAPLIKNYFGKHPRDNAAGFISIPDMVNEYKIHYKISTGNIVNSSRRRNENDYSAEMRVGLSMRHPYMRFVLQEKPDLFPDQTKIDYLRYNRKLDIELYRYNRKAEAINTLIPFDWRKTFSYEAPETADELLNALQKLAAFNTPKRLRDFDSFSSLSYGYGYQRDPNHTVDAIDKRLHLTTLPFVETYLFISRPDAPYLDFRRLPENQLRLSPDEMGDFKDAYKAAICKQMNRNAEIELEDHFPLHDLVDVYNHYRKWYGAGSVDLLGNMPALQQQYETKIIERLRRSPDIAGQIQLTETLLFRNNIKNPESRNALITIWLQAKAEFLGKDDNSQAYRENFKTLVAEVEKNARMGQGPNMITQLLDAVEAQQNVAFDTRDYLIDKLLEKGMNSHLLAAGNDFLMERLGQNPNSRNDVLAFLTTPLSDESTQHALTNLNKNGTLLTESFLSKEAQLDGVASLHRNFWSLPFVARTVYLERVLFPVEAEEGQFEEATRYVMDSVLSTDKAYAQEARQILEIYLKEVSKPLQRLVLSALITASEKTAETQDLRAGQVLSMVLGKSGPAGGKILQAIHSYLQSVDSDNPDFIALREDLKSSKTDYSPPFRWEIFERIRDVMPEDLSEGIQRVNHLLGAGSYAYTVGIKREGDEETALSLLRPDAASEAEYQFERFGRVAAKLAEQDSKWDMLPAILEDGKQRASVEGDFTACADQIHYQESLRQDMHIRINGRDYTIGTAPLIAYGREFKETKMAPGVHFSDLAPDTPEARIHRKELAQVKWTAGIYDLLRGGAFDQDQHAGNLRVSGQILTEFDHGAIPYNMEHRQIIEPTEQDKKILGTLLGQAINATASGKINTDEYLVEAMRDTKIFGDSSPYLERAKQHVLALNDYMLHMGDTPTERNAAMQESIAAILKTGNVDKTIMEAASSVIDKKVMKGLKKGALTSTLEIQERNISSSRHRMVRLAGRTQAWRDKFSDRVRDKFNPANNDNSLAPRKNWADEPLSQDNQRRSQGRS